MIKELLTPPSPLRWLAIPCFIVCIWLIYYEYERTMRLNRKGGKYWWKKWKKQWTDENRKVNKALEQAMKKKIKTHDQQK